MPEILQFGPFMIRLSWLFFAVSGIVGYIIMKYKWKRTAYNNKPDLDILTSGLLIFVFVWKFSPVLFTPSILWTSPLSILFISGSTESAWIGISISTIYIGFKCWRMSEGRWLLLDLLPYGISAAVVVYSLLLWQYGTATDLPWGISIQDPAYKYHPINVYRIIVTVPLFLWLWKQHLNKLGSGELFSDFLTFFGIGLLLVSFFKLQTKWMLGMSGEQFVYFILVVAGSILGTWLKKKRRNPVVQTEETL